MADSDILKIPLLSNGQVNQFATANEGTSFLERAANDIFEVVMSADQVLLLADFVRAAVFIGLGHSVARNLTVPQSKRLFVVHNMGTASGVLNVVRGSTTIALAVAAAPSWFYTDGTTNGLFKIG